MPAISIADLFNFESNFEGPLANYLGNVNASWQILTPRTLANAALGTDILRTPRITCEVHVTGSGIQRETSAGATSNGSSYYADRNGQVQLTIVTQRANTAQNYGLMRGSARQAMLESSAVWSNVTAPYYQVTDVQEGGSVQMPMEGNDEIMTQITFPFHFFILPASFP